MNLTRVRNLNNRAYKGGVVVYQMCRDIRVHDNDALLYAQELAQSKEAALVVNYVIWNYTWKGATRRFYNWIIPSLQEVESELRKYNIPLIITFEEENLFSKKIFSPTPSFVGAVVIDSLPLRFMSKWKETFLQLHTTVPLYEVDAHNIIPVHITSSKQEFAARTIRPKIYDKISSYLEEYGNLQVHKENISLTPEINWGEVIPKIICDEKVSSVGDFIPGEKAAQEMMHLFLDEKIHNYETTRNDFSKNGQSDLSPYLSHGNISRRRIVLELLKKKRVAIETILHENKNGSSGTNGPLSAFIEELVVRAELAENFCYYNAHYDSYEGFPAWAQAALEKGSTDTRESLYTLEEFEGGKTHDDLWNAAQMQMVKSGKMHGYLRMYWAKKILEWSNSPKEAMKIAVYLNDTYELDGRDPNGYVGCAWSIGGVHDRPWFPRPVFGTIRYMAESGAKKNGDIKKYIATWLGDQPQLL